MMAIRANDVIGPDVDEERITCKNGWSNEGVSNVRMSDHPQLRQFVNLTLAIVLWHIHLHNPSNPSLT